MKRKAHVSKSTYRAILSIQKSRDEPSGLFISDRFFQPEKEHRPHHLLWFLADVFLLSCLMGGLMVLFFAGFSVPRYMYDSESHPPEQQTDARL